MDSAENCLEQLRKHTIIVADTGEINLIKKLNPKDATTNPSLIAKACELPDYQGLITDAIEYSTTKLNTKDPNNSELISLVLDKLIVNFGIEILKVIEGYVSTEVDSRLSFDRDGTIEKARRIISLYEEAGINRNRILIKVAATWEGIKAAEILEKEGIRTNLTLIFTLTQAIACAESGVTLVSPFIGRLNDAFIQKHNKKYEPHEEPGVVLVTGIYNYYKKFGYNTIVMGASFRSFESVLELVGIDRVTMPPAVIEKLVANNQPIDVKLTPEKAKASNAEKVSLDEKAFRWRLNEEDIGNEKLCDGIRLFTKDILKLESIVKAKIQ